MATDGSNDKFLDIFARLSDAFADKEVRSRSQGGREFQYVTARTVMNRLDEVLGPAGWWDEYQTIGADADAVICKLSIMLPDGRVLCKTDAGGCSKTQDPSDSEKSGFSDAFKRAAVKFGVGRYLYGDGVAPSIRAELIDQRRREREANPPREPGSDDDRDHQPPQQQHDDSPRSNGNGNSNGQQQRSNGGGSAYGNTPKSGKALYAWAREQGEKHGVDVVALVNDFGKSNSFPFKMVAWDDAQVAEGHREAVEYLAHNGAQSGGR